MVIEESNMRFEFPEDIVTVKFDDEPYYRKSFNILQDSNGPLFMPLTERRNGD